jgi:hypothetical protein
MNLEELVDSFLAKFDISETATYDRLESAIIEWFDVAQPPMHHYHNIV